MGEIIRVNCPYCDVSHGEEFVGVGMMGKGTALVVCEHCQRFVRKRLDAFNDADPERPYRCPYCHRGTIEVVADVERPAPCPECGATLEVEWAGLWD